jgi:hypothetical protein
VQAVPKNQKFFFRRSRIAFLAIAIAFAQAFCPPQHTALRAAPQEEYEQHDEVVANLAAGRVIITVLKDAILIASIENHLEPEAQAPAIIQLGARRAAILLGAISWNSPSPPVEWANLATELPTLHANMTVAVAPHLQGSAVGAEAKDLEDVGEGLRIRLSSMMKKVHGNLEVPEDEPLVELVLADYVVDYGPEVWTLQYAINQQPERGDFWDSKIQRPRYAQLWPPEKTAPHTLIEIQYPQGEKTPTLLDLLRQKSPQLEVIGTSDPAMAAVAAAILRGDTSKLQSADAVPYLRACLNALMPPSATLAIARIDQEQGFEWLLAPPPPPKKIRPETEPNAPSLQKPQPNRPSLLNPPPK